MANIRPSMLSLLVCSTLLSGCDLLSPAEQEGNHPETADAGADAEQVQALSATPGEGQNVAPQPAAPNPAGDSATAKAPAGAPTAVPPEPENNAELAKKQDKAPEGAQPIPKPVTPLAPLVSPSLEKLVPHVAIEAMIRNGVRFSKDKSPKTKALAFVPNAKVMWLQLEPGSDLATLEIGLPAADLALFAGDDDHKSMALDMNGSGAFKELRLKAVTDIRPPANSIHKTQGQLQFLSTQIRIDVKRMATVLTEYNNRKAREIVEFHPGSPQVARRHHAARVDVAAFLAGSKVDLSLLSRMSPLGSLGARPVAVDRDRSLMIRDLRVIEDPKRTVNPCDRASTDNMNKIWGFGFLMNEMAKRSGVSTQEFVESWLQTWSETQTIRAKDGTLLDEISDHAGFALRHGVIKDWRRRSGGHELDLRIAPFRLLSIIYRPDLAQSSPLLDPANNNAGELRFVFGMMRTRDLNHDGDSNDWFETCNSIEASVILEYKVPAFGCEISKSWANEILHLSELPLGSEKYNSTLARLSYATVRSGANEHRPNGSALGQLRTNEIGISTAWQMREFHLDAKSGLLKQSTVADSPRHHGRLFSRTHNTPSPISLRGKDIMVNEIKENLSSILAGRYNVPELSEHGDPLLGGAVTLLGPFGRFESHALKSREERAARFSIGVNSCDGCHTAETGTLFYHIFPNRPGKPTRFSAYLQNSPHKTTHLNARLQLEHYEFDETAARRQALYGLANQSCAIDRGLIPTQMTHAPLKRIH